MTAKTLFEDLSERINEALRNSPAQDIEKNLRVLLASWFDRMDLVLREDFETQKRLLEQAQDFIGRITALHLRRRGWVRTRPRTHRSMALALSRTMGCGCGLYRYRRTNDVL